MSVEHPPVAWTVSAQVQIVERLVQEAVAMARFGTAAKCAQLEAPAADAGCDLAGWLLVPFAASTHPASSSKVEARLDSVL